MKERLQNLPLLLRGIEYLVSEADDQIIFKCNDGMSSTTMAFEFTGCGWYLIALQDQWERIYAPHIIAAYEWIDSFYHIEYNDGVGTVTRR